jgi:DNA (cytosine-5)-methyltransferase 3A
MKTDKLYKPMNILSLFDGMSCGQQALQRAGINVNQYFASEIDKFAIQVTMANFPNTIQLGSVVNVDGYSLPKIDILIGGSPCQSFSFAGKRKGMATKDEQEILTLEHYLELKAEGFEFEGQSYLFWEYMRLLNETKPTYFLLENVMMGEKWEKVLSKAIGVKPIMINSALVSAQNRQRLYWTNIGLAPAGLFGDLETTIQQPKDKGVLLKDVLESNVDDKYFISQRMIDSFNIKTDYYKSIGGGFEFKPNEGYGKGITLTNPAKNRMDDNWIICHNTMPRSSKSGKGGSGHLSDSDGRTYCLDTGSTNAIEIIKGARMTGRDPENPKSRKPCSNTEQMIEERFDNKSGTLTTVQKDSLLSINKNIRRLTPIECERLQTVADNYTNHVSDSQRYKMLGNGWTVDVIVHILKYINLNQ